jgi:bacterial leucyl aminopeptidase
VWAFSTFTSDRLDLYYAANASSPVWTFLATLSPSAGGAQTLSTTYTLPAGALQAVRARFRYQGSAAACASGSYIDHDDLVFAVQ